MRVCNDFVFQYYYIGIKLARIATSAERHQLSSYDSTTDYSAFMLRPTRIHMGERPLQCATKFNNYSIIHVHAPTEDEEDFTKNLTICGNDVQDVMVTLMPKWAKKRNFVL
ncbi:hypothetical protein CEXT_113382 [Caerostris extrusa]|uniref:Uncharacterized protein n=1 Tax=Caerostris extrusa TaxID=172846 RepID=A0AAV4MC45_CAEEX|nr:hypothetical protein CEXT_113382 [Caerostris extrusa]